jgi:outer membrane murein-binding lipoprotein Lpp
MFEPQEQEIEAEKYRPERQKSNFDSRRMWPIFALVLIMAAGLFGYAVHERSVADGLAAKNGQLASNVSDVHSQMDALSTKLAAISEAQQRAEQAAVAAKRQTKTVVTQRRRVDDSRWKKMQAALDDQAKAIDATRQDLTNTGTELRGSIAKTHDELVVLQRKGERSYFEFDLDKAKQFQHAGPVGVSLRKANTKHSYADLELVVEDAQMSQKHVNLYQPVMFYAGDTGAPMELVINSVRKNHIHGYISTPKYRNSELTAMSAAAPQNGTTQTATSQSSASQVTAPPLRQRLPNPKE